MNRNAGMSAGFIALLALVAHVAAPPGREQGSASQAASGKVKQPQGSAHETGGTPADYEGPWMATRHFFAPYEPPPSTVEDSAAKIVDFTNPQAILECSQDPGCLVDLRQFFGMQDSARVEGMLAIVPDPFHTRLALYADHSLGAIRKGASFATWEFATQWLPWNDTVDPDEGDPVKRVQERANIRVQEKQPGVLVFRRANLKDSKDLRETVALLIFVVGETPTAGVNPGQFQIARAYLKALCRPEDVRIDGPTFSGSLYSLASLIQQDKGKDPGKSYRVHSGTTQSPGAVKSFQSRAGSRVQFASATGDLDLQDRYFLKLLKDLRIPTDQAAVLAEDESAFGSAAASRTSIPWASGPVRVFRFPRDISHLRNAYRQVVQSSQAPKSPALNLDFSLKDPEVGEDSVPNYSQAQTPLSQYGVINEIARTIRRDNIRIVKISATNVLDLLFLAGVFRRQCPDTRLLIQFADLLFIQAEKTQPLDGTLFLTSFPLFAESNLWEGHPDIAIFPDTLSEGVYDATVLLLGKSVTPSPSWLLTLDRRGFTPVRAWSTSCWVPVPGGVAPPLIWKALLIGFSLCGLAIGIWIIALHAKTDWVVDARLEPPEFEDSWRGFFLFLGMLILLGIQLGIFLARPFGSDWHAWPRLLLLLCGGGLTASIAAWLGRPGQRHRRAMWLAAIVVLAGVGLWSYCCFGQGTRSRLFAFRAAELRFGSSPLWPIVGAATALLLWCFVHVTRLNSALREQPDVIASGLGEMPSGRIQETRDHFDACARAALGLSPRWLGFAVAVLAGLSCLLRVDVHLGSIDGGAYDILCITLQLVVAGLLVLTCCHIRNLWKSLHCFSASLGTIPLARAFVQACPAGGSRPIWVRRLSFQCLEIHHASLLILHDMRLQRKQLAKRGLSAARVSAWGAIYRRRMDDALQTGTPVTRRILEERHRKLRRFSKLLASQLSRRILQPAWRSESLAGTVAGQDTVAPSGQLPQVAGNPLDIAHLAETLVALHYTPFLLYGVRQIQNLLWFPSIGFVLLMVSMSSYSFQAPQSIERFLMILFAAIAWILGTCMAEIERDPILSRIAGTKPGELNAPFYLRLARYGALPVIGLLASQFPFISNFLFSWVEPALEALK